VAQSVKDALTPRRRCCFPQWEEEDRKCVHNHNTILNSAKLLTVTNARVARLYGEHVLGAKPVEGLVSPDSIAPAKPVETGEPVAGD